MRKKALLPILSERSEGYQGSGPPLQMARGECLKDDPRVRYLS